MRYTVVAIEREYASGGRAIGELTAEKLDIASYGRALLELAAKRIGLSVAEAEKLEETASGSLVYSIFLARKATVGDMVSPPTAEALSQTEAEIIRELADREPCVLIGRGCVTALADRKHVLRVFVHADEQSRRERAISLYNVEETAVDATLKAYDRQRAKYYQANTVHGWRDPGNYHLILDSGKLGLEACVDIIVAACRG